jgi:signal transduction histidine kinase
MISVVVHFAERRSNFVAAVSHELKTPLTAIRMYAEMLRDGYVLSEEKRAEYYETMAAESERLSRLIQNVLELSRLEKGARSGGEVVTGDVRPVLEEAVRVLERHARDRGFTVVLDLPDELPVVRYDRDGLLQVLINLVDNGIKFSKDADPREVVIQAVPRGGGLTLQIRDHGPGVPQRQLSHIFQPFYRGERELTRRTKGTGIGLALVKGIVDGMGGSVSARNHPEGGFEVRVALVA